MQAATNQEFVHNGRKIVIISQDEASASSAHTPASFTLSSPAVAKVKIDDESVPLRYDMGSKKYIAIAHSPYMNFDSLTDLAKHVADHVIGKRSP